MKTSRNTHIQSHNIIVHTFVVDLSLEPCFDVGYSRHLTESDLPDFVRRYCHDTKMRYVQQPVLPEFDWPPSLGGQYIRLALIKQGRSTRDFKYNAVIELQEDYVRGNYDKILRRKTEIQLEEIFDPVFCEGGYEFPLKMLIDGAPGVGKTTLGRNVGQKWAEGELLQGYWLVLLLHLRETAISRAQTIDDFFYHDDKKLQDAAITFVKETSGRGVLIIFDGFDELSLEERSRQSLCLDVIKGKKLCQCAVIVTSRPCASRPLQGLQSVNRHVEVLGFMDEEIRLCIEQRIDDKTKSENLWSELQDRLDVASICQIPLNCSIVLYVYEQEDYQLPNTLTEIYELFVLHGLKRYCTRTVNVIAAETLQDLNNLPSPLQEYLVVLSKLAFDGLKMDKLVFPKCELAQAFSALSGTFTITDVPVLDLMTVAKSYSSRGTHDTYSFLHLTIQEYLSAFWAAKYLSDAEKLNFLMEYLRNDRFSMVLWFFSGITGLNFSDVQSVFDRIVWMYDHVHICHLLYESDCKNHSHCSYIANRCLPLKELIIACEPKTSQVSSRYIGRNKYSRFDTLTIVNFLAYSECQWNSLTLNLHHVQAFHKVFTGINPCQTFVKQVEIEVDVTSIASFTEITTCLLDKILQFGNKMLKVIFCPSYVDADNIQIVSNNLEKMLTMINVGLVCFELKGVLNMALPNFVEIAIKAVVHNIRIKNLELHGFNVEELQYLVSSLIKWNSKVKLVTLSVEAYCQQGECIEFFRSFSTFLATNMSLKQIDIKLPLNNIDVLKCDDFESKLNTNYTLKRLTVGKIIYERIDGKMKGNKHEAIETIRSRALYNISAQSSTDTPWASVLRPVFSSGDKNHRTSFSDDFEQILELDELTLQLDESCTGIS